MNQVEIKRKQAQAVSNIMTLITLAVIAHLVGYNGVAYIAAAIETVAAVWLAIAGNLSDTLGRILRFRNAKGQKRNAAGMRKNALFFQAAIGLAGSIGLFVGADQIARLVFRVQYGTFILMVMSPVVFLRTLSAVLLGYFQGEGSELPTVFSVVLRQIFILGFSLLFGRMLGDYGGKVSRLLVQENLTSMYGGVGVGIAVSVAELFIVVFLFLIYRFSRISGGGQPLEGMRAPESFADSVRNLCAARGLQWMTALLAYLPVPLGFIFLSKSAELESVAVSYGVYASCYWVVCGILVSVILIPTYPVCGRMVVYLRKEDQRFARTVFQSGVHICMVHAAFASVFLMAMAPQLSKTFCDGQAEAAEGMLRGGGLGVLFLVLSLYFGRILNLAGWKVTVLSAVGAADVTYVVSVALMLRSDGTGVQALVYAGVLGLGVACVLLGVLSCRQLHIRLNWIQLLMSGGAACVVGLLCMLLGRVLTPHLGNVFTLIALFIICSALYWVLLIFLRNFRDQELDVLPGGRLIRALGQMMRVY